MPLVRVEVRNEYGLGLPEIYKEANREDPKAVLDAVAVAGLVGILRQLGDLAEFAAEVFHGLQEQVMSTSSRSHKLMVRVQHIEAELPPVEKAIFAQRNHLPFAYTAGSNWHARVRSEQNHFIYHDLPRFIMDSYEECRGPPRLHLLDKFDTGGPGSCLKRYSDPTFFKRASAGSNDANIEKVSRDKKARRIKKKRSWLKNGEISRGPSISKHSGRMQFASPNVDGQISPQTVSTFDGTLKSDMGDQRNSFDSRTGSGYIECVFHPSYSVQPEEHEPKESSSSQFKIHHNDTLDSAFLDEKSGFVDDYIRNSLSQEQTGPSSSFVTWDEKTEIVEPTGQQCDYDVTPEILPTNFDRDTQEMEVVNFRTADQMDFQFDNENTPTSSSGGNQLDDIDSEPDNYMDALNTIESESETDVDFQTKREVEQYSDLNIKAIEDGMHRLTENHSDCHPSNFESHIPAYSSSNKATSSDNPNSFSPESHTAAYSSSNKGTSEDKPNSVSSECYAPVVPPQTVCEPLNTASLPDIDLCASADSLDGSNVESVVGNTSSSDFREPISQAPMSDKIISTPSKSQKSPPEPCSGNPIKFWTNGGLLGLEPSKPLDCSVLNAVNQDSVGKSKDDTICPLSQNNILECDGHSGKPDVLVNSSKIIEQGPSSKCSTSCHNDQEDGISIKKTSSIFSPDDLDAKVEKSGDVHHSNSFNHAHSHGFNETSIMTPGTERPVSLDVQATKANQEDDKNSSRAFELGNSLLVNGFRRKLSLVRDDISDPASSLNTGAFEQKSRHQTVAYQTFSGRTFKEQFRSGSPIMSPSSSPPLEHMKISFQPMDLFQTSTLKLKFPHGNNCHESGDDMFPSFQLVPEPAIPLHDIGSDSDDDTFCRSSPYMSEDCLSHYSQSNSEQWEAGESPISKDHELYDALHRISSKDSVLSSLDIGGIGQEGIRDNCGIQSPFTDNDVELSQSGSILDMPSFDTLRHSFKQESKNDPDGNDLLESHFPKEPMPSSPPLPPLLWRAMKSHADVAEDQQDAVSEVLNYAFDPKVSESFISQQPKPAPVKQDQNIEAACTLKSNNPHRQKLNGQKEANQAANGIEMDEKEDFLYQIRTKSFSLRRTATARPTFSPVPPTNVKVTAILEKANAIRQAVGSDDGEDDDNWSDT